MDIKLNHLAESLKQFIKIVEVAREKRLHPLLLTKEQLQEIITEIHFKLSEYEFPIPTSHFRAEVLSKLGKTPSTKTPSPSTKFPQPTHASV